MKDNITAIVTELEGILSRLRKYTEEYRWYEWCENNPCDESRQGDAEYHIERLLEFRSQDKNLKIIKGGSEDG